jgi:hypothetical protein
MTHTIYDDHGTAHEYEIATHPATQGFHVAGRIAGLFGPSLSKVVGGLLAGKSLQEVKGVLDADLDGQTIAAGVSDVVLMLAGGEFQGLVKELVQYCIRDNRPLSNQAAFDMAFQANYGELAELLVLVLRENGFHRFLLRLAKAGRP